jgi:hypothetical protein
MAVPYLFSGMFSFCAKLVPAMKKESIFTKEGVFGCDDFNFRFWKLRRSTLLRKVFSAAVEIRRRFLRRRLIFQRQEKAGGFFTAGRKNRSIFPLSSKADRRFQWQRETFLMSFSSRCVEVVHRRL